MKHPRISHVIADISSKDSLDSVSGYHNSYDVQSNAFMLSDVIHTHCRRKRIDDDVIIKSVFLDNRDRQLSNQDIIKMMRDNNMIPQGMHVKDEFVALEPTQIISLAYLLIDPKDHESQKENAEEEIDKDKKSTTDMAEAG
ncbi:hypothetical protein GQR58_028181 [Nymphon striatum]|nr:hypothetical protein GQR58_028181 [Nymphon striatum]